MNLPEDSENGGLNQSSLLGAFLANRTHLPGNEKVKKMNATYGPKCYDLYMKLNPTSSWARTFLGYLIGMGAWFSTRCLLTWEVRGTMSHPWLYLRRRSMPPTEGIESGLLPTVTAQEVQTGFIYQRGMLPTPIASDIHHAERVKKLKETGAETMASRKNGANRPNGLTDFLDFNGMLPTPTAMMDEAPIEKVDARNQKQIEKGNSPFILGLAQQAMRGMLPTPTSYDYNSARTPEKWEEDQKKYAEKGVNLQMGLKQMARLQMLPTPTATDFKGAYPPTSINNNEARKSMLRNVYQHTNVKYHSKSSQLNPRFVAEMMGYPPNWTELPFQNGETNQ